MTTGDVVEYLEEVYETTISRGLVSMVTERVAKEMQAWQTRPLDPVVLVDASVTKVRDGSVGQPAGPCGHGRGRPRRARDDLRRPPRSQLADDGLHGVLDVPHARRRCRGGVVWA